MNNSNYFLGIMTAIVGLMMLLAAEPVVQVVVVVLGISAILSGGFMLAAVAPLSDDKTFKTQCYIRAAVGIVIGILCVVIPLRVAQFAWQTMVCIFAVYSLASAILEIPIALTLRRDGLPVKRYAIEIAASFALAVVLFLLPSSVGFTIIRIGGAALMLAGAAIAFLAWKNRDIIADDAIVRDE
ncbi:MAG: DUF308 domain-containing protein [Treponema sp.]|nr:DUF308 domain-containing protein [Treponema sp.]MBR3542895.1 DUF308 domain-containing protein [Treponema sp.]